MSNIIIDIVKIMYLGAVASSEVKQKLRKCLLNKGHSGSFGHSSLTSSQQWYIYTF